MSSRTSSATSSDDLDERNETIEEGHDIEKAPRYVFSDKNGCVFILRITLPFDVPVLNCTNDVSFVRRPELNLDFIPTKRIRILTEEVESTRMGLDTFFVLEDEIAKSEY